MIEEHYDAIYAHDKGMKVYLQVLTNGDETLTLRVFAWGVAGHCLPHDDHDHSLKVQVIRDGRCMIEAEFLLYSDLATFVATFGEGLAPEGWQVERD